MTQHVPSMPKRASGSYVIAAVGLIILIIGLCWMPGLGLWTVPIAAAGLIIAIVGFVSARAGGSVGTVLPIIGVLIVAAIILAIFFLKGGSFSGMHQGIERSQQSAPLPSH